HFSIPHEFVPIDAARTPSTALTTRFIRAFLVTSSFVNCHSVTSLCFFLLCCKSLRPTELPLFSPVFECILPLSIRGAFSPTVLLVSSSGYKVLSRAIGVPAYGQNGEMMQHGKGQIAAQVARIGQYSRWHQFSLPRKVSDSLQTWVPEIHPTV